MCNVCVTVAFRISETTVNFTFSTKNITSNYLKFPYKDFMKRAGIDKFHVGFEVLTAVTVNSVIFWDITPCIPV
jgi:hypothetical protein